MGVVGRAALYSSPLRTCLQLLDYGLVAGTKHQAQTKHCGLARSPKQSKLVLLIHHPQYIPEKYRFNMLSSFFELTESIKTIRSQIDQCIKKIAERWGCGVIRKSKSLIRHSMHFDAWSASLRPRSKGPPFSRQR